MKINAVVDIKYLLKKIQFCFPKFIILYETNPLDIFSVIYASYE